MVRIAETGCLSMTRSAGLPGRIRERRIEKYFFTKFGLGQTRLRFVFGRTALDKRSGRKDDRQYDKEILLFHCGIEIMTDTAYPIRLIVIRIES